MTILDGRKTSSDIKDEIAVAVNEITASGARAPHLVAVIAGEDGASLTYVGSKVRAVSYTHLTLPTIYSV